ncbi:MAG: hypothetical protein K2N72_13920 [Oscillospiraceae bacterium]|nr:hypothetical protein [Oscillospiraceae bacterium]
MNRFTKVIDKVQDTVTELGARAMVTAVNTTGKLMTTRAGKAMLVVPAAMSACTVTASAEDATAQGMIDGIMGILGPGIIGLGTLVAVVGGIQTGVGFKDDNADGKTRGFQTLIGGAIIAAVGALVPSTISLGG